MFSLYYLIDQSGEITGAKNFVGLFATILDAEAQAEIDQVIHFSIEQPIMGGSTIVVIQ
jgi:hypothetical protein